jgi:peptidoglycan/LPS O-acetylase OafA/YrhL
MLGALTAFRFLAAFGVVLHHLRYGTYIGGVAVTFFFVLSGFILTYTYAAGFTSLGGRTLPEYGMARIARIFPVHLATFILSLPLAGGRSAVEAITNILLQKQKGANALILRSEFMFLEKMGEENG